MPRFQFVRVILTLLIFAGSALGATKPHVVSFGKWTPIKWCVGPNEGKCRWVWQRGGWLLVDRMTGHVSAISLPEFDSYYSVASWYRDYVAYCGVSDDGKKLFAVVFQVGRRKPVLKKPLGETTEDDMPDSECPAPAWERRPTRVTFEAGEDEKLTYAVRGHAADLVNSGDDEDGEKASK